MMQEVTVNALAKRRKVKADSVKVPAETTVNEPVAKRRKVADSVKVPAEVTVNEPVAKRRTVKADLDKVRAYIAGVWEKNETRIPPERELAEAIGLTRSRLRGALKKLVDEQVIWREVGSGTYVGQRPLVGATGSGRTTELAELTNPLEVMEARLLLEPELARLAALRARGENMTELETSMQKMANSTSESDWSFWDRRFHHAIGRAANNTLLLALLETIQGNMDRGTWGELSEKLHSVSSPEGSMQDHMGILTSIKNRNSSAAFEAMRAHLLRVQKIYFGG
jgi:DNA-binding FadR family transcriptional regulator